MDRHISASAPPSTGKAAAPGATGGKNPLPDNTTWSLVALEHAPVGVVMINETGRIVAFNAIAERMFQYKAGEVIGQPVGMLAADSTRKKSSRKHKGLYACDCGWRVLSGRERRGKHLPERLGGITPLRAEQWLCGAARGCANPPGLA